MISRRQFLRGNFSAPDPVPDGPRIARVGNRCLVLASTLCRSCGDACGETAIRFPLRPGGIALPEIVADRCTGCGDCVTACPAGALTLVAQARRPINPI